MARVNAGNPTIQALAPDPCLLVHDAKLAAPRNHQNAAFGRGVMSVPLGGRGGSLAGLSRYNIPDQSARMTESGSAWPARRAARYAAATASETCLRCCAMP